MSETNSSNEQLHITLTDLKNMLVFIELCTQRGALRSPELVSVGSLYEKINKFVQSAETKNSNETSS